jgi:hypothetical protein
MKRSKEVSSKVKFIINYYNAEKNKFNTVEKLDLLNRWIESCVEFEEFEMAHTLKLQRGYVMRAYRKENGRKRNILETFELLIKILIRKFKTIRHNSKL